MENYLIFEGDMKYIQKMLNKHSDEYVAVTLIKLSRPNDYSVLLERVSDKNSVDINKLINEQLELMKKDVEKMINEAVKQNNQKINGVGKKSTANKTVKQEE